MFVWNQRIHVYSLKFKKPRSLINSFSYKDYAQIRVSIVKFYIPIFVRFFSFQSGYHRRFHYAISNQCWILCHQSADLNVQCKILWTLNPSPGRKTCTKTFCKCTFLYILLSLLYFRCWHKYSLRKVGYADTSPYFRMVQLQSHVLIFGNIWLVVLVFFLYQHCSIKK